MKLKGETMHLRLRRPFTLTICYIIGGDVR